MKKGLGYTYIALDEDFPAGYYLTLNGRTTITWYIPNLLGIPTKEFEKIILGCGALKLRMEDIGGVFHCFPIEEQIIAAITMIKLLQK